MSIKQLYKKQQAFFNSNKTKDLSFRIAQLKKLKKLLKDNEQALYQAIYEDFGKSKFETYATELVIIYHEISNCIKNLKRWSKPKRVFTGLGNFPAKSYILSEPLGTTLIIGAWNYPYQLSLSPALTSIAAGNTVIIKPSEISPNTSTIMAELINDHFPAEHLRVVEGGVAETTELLANRFDKIFFTGSTNVGRIIYQAAAKHLTPVTLELGGKSPTFVMADANIKVSAKRIVWAKFLNAGQTCVAPDYILVEKSIESKFLEALKHEITQQFKDPETIGENYMQIINQRNFDRLNKLIDGDKVYCGAYINKAERHISPTVLNDISFEDEIMKDEIFGPILPVISFTDLDQMIKEVKQRPRPLSFYIYSKNRRTIKKLLKEISFGGGAINDSVMHLSISNLPFGGVGLSGMGNYHGKYGFETFSHKKSILDKPFWLEPSVKYAPYSKFKRKLIGWLLE